MATQALTTAAEFDRLPAQEGRRLELVDGEVVEVASASPEHNCTRNTLSFSLTGFAVRTQRGVVLPTTEFACGESRLQPDLAWLRGEEWDGLNRTRVPVHAVPLIAVEIVSPSEPYRHVARKIDIYLQSGVAAVWMVEPWARRVYVHTRTGVERHEGDSLLQSPLLPGWVLSLSDLFRLL